MSVAFKTTIRVYYEDTDAGGIVYYANYLRFMERCRTDWLRDLGHDVFAINKESGIFFAVRSTCVEYLKPAHLSDLLIVTVAIHELKRASLEVAQHIFRDNDLICEAKVRLASLDANSMHPAPIPKPLLNDIKQWKTP